MNLTVFQNFHFPKIFFFAIIFNNNCSRDLQFLLNVAIKNYDIKVNYPERFFCPHFQPFQSLHKHHVKTYQNICNFRGQVTSLLS